MVQEALVDDPNGDGAAPFWAGNGRKSRESSSTFHLHDILALARQRGYPPRHLKGSSFLPALPGEGSPPFHAYSRRSSSRTVEIWIAVRYEPLQDADVVLENT